jgi:menaquinone-specific isochorismate synthase
MTRISEVGALSARASSAKAASAKAAPAKAERLVSAVRPCPGASAAVLLEQAQGQERFYWAGAGDGLIIAAFGVAAELVAWGPYRFELIRKKAEALFQDAWLPPSSESAARPRLFGGFAFRDDFTPDNTWSVFHPAHFILPHFQLVRRGPEAWLTINSLLPGDESPAESLPWLEEALAARCDRLLSRSPASRKSPGGGPAESEGRRVVRLDYPMPFATWEAQIEEAGRRFQAKGLQKVVLSRIGEAWLDGRADVDGALAYLDSHYANSIRFLFEPRPRHTFFGASPELLVAVEKSDVTTMALASSIRRGRTPEEDTTLAAQLLHDPKERLEHDLVVRAIERRLAPLTQQLIVPPEPAVLPLANIQHLYTPIQGRLRQAADALSLVELLHPTPALGGSPRDLAMAFIHQAESAPRGWYAAPIGWLDANLDGAFAVAIRSAVTQEERVWLYAGAGIVAGSDPHKEWEETGLKFRPILEALGISTELDVKAE